MALVREAALGLVNIQPVWGEKLAFKNVFNGGAKVGALPFTGIKERIPKYAANATITAIPPKIISAYLYLEKINLLFLTFCCRLAFFGIQGSKTI